MIRRDRFTPNNPYLVKVFASVGHAAGHAEALAQGTRGNIDEIQPKTMFFSILGCNHE